ncbi:hematopoietic prostaglandin D synthase-like isoform X1 [Hyperolius riggenbachi]|uniref:hematopoietic prostaglandin D synthase-like isoform X1 n=1 Tax=Hyperolius riggenbachi TaxID=752182 RepID=UPI0035A2A337
MAQYKLTYFEFRGKGELIRYLFACMNIEYEDYKIDFSEWPQHRSSYLYGKLPILEINGTVYNQSLAIGRYLAKKAGMTGKTELDDLHIDAIIDTINDFVTYYPWFSDKTKMEEYLDKDGKIYLSGLEKQLGEHNWFAGDYVTWADFFWDICGDSIKFYVPEFAKGYPKLSALQKRVKEVPEIAAWIERRTPAWR